MRSSSNNATQSTTAKKHEDNINFSKFEKIFQIFAIFLFKIRLRE